MALGLNERQRSAVPLQDPDGRLIVVGPNGVPIAGGGGGAGADPLSDGDPAGALPSKTLWVAGADGTTLRGLVVDASGRLRTVVEGTPAVSVSNFPGTQPVSGSVSVSNFPATQPVTGPVTDAQLRASAVPVSGPVTDAQLRASAVPVTDSRLPAALDADGGLKSHIQNTVPVSGTFFQATQPVSLAAVPTVTEKQDQPAGTTATWTSATALNTALTTNTTGYGTATVSIQVPSTVTGGVITLEVSDDNTVWYQAGAVRVDNAKQENVVPLAYQTNNGNRMYSISVDAMTQVRIRLSTVITGTGNVIVRTTLVAGGIEPFVAEVPTFPNRQSITVAWIDLIGTAAIESGLLATANAQRGGTNIAGGATSFAVTTGKTFRINSIQVVIRATSTVNNYGFFRLRQAATVANTSPIIFNAFLALELATVAAPALSSESFSFPDGLEIPGGQQIGFTVNTAAASCGVSLNLVGFEYG